jgi:hypothetical protein
VKIFDESSLGVVSKVSLISVIFVATLVEPYNKAVVPFIVGALIVVPAIPVMSPEVIVPVLILTFEFKVGCFVSN